MKKQTELQKLRLENLILKASSNTTRYYAKKDLNTKDSSSYMASGLILEIKNLSGVTVVGPVMISDGLSRESIDALIQDIDRSIKLSDNLK